MITLSSVLWALAIGILAVGIVLLVQFVNRRQITVKWYNWVLGGLGLALLLFAFQNFFTSFSEDEAPAAWWFLLTFGLVGVIFVALAWRLVAMGSKKVSESSEAKTA